MRLHGLLLLLLTASTSGVLANDGLSYTGLATVIDGDTIKINGHRIRLHGIDAPEKRQLCYRNGQQYRCGLQASLALSAKIGQTIIRCQKRDIDHYNRIVAVCRLNTEDLNSWIVRQGWAVAYRKYSLDYNDDESDAIMAKIGLWAGNFIVPSRWRHGDRLPSSKDYNKSSCKIKGNINRSGKRIFHVPEGKFYELTKINKSKGENWFCSEQKARKARWRKSRQ